MRPRHVKALALAGAVAVSFAGLARAQVVDGSGSPAAVTSEGGKYLDKEGNPTFNVNAEGAVDWYTYSGFRRYHSECHVCHGPEGEGSTYAPALKESLKKLSYSDFSAVVVQGRVNVNASQNNVMPSFGDNSNVMCYLDDIFVYLRARADGAVERGRPQKREEKSPAVTATENACLGNKG